MRKVTTCERVSTPDLIVESEYMAGKSTIRLGTADSSYLSYSGIDANGAVVRMNIYPGRHTGQNQRHHSMNEKEHTRELSERMQHAD